MLRIKNTLVAAILVGTLWAQNQPTTSEDSAGQTASPRPAAASSATPSTQLDPVEKVQAVYPSAAREKNIRGQVLVMILISEKGDVENASVARGDPALGDAALEAAKRWKFRPFVQDGQPIAAIANLSFDFESSAAAADNSSAESWVTKASVDKARAFPTSIRVSSGVIKAMLLKQVAPNYPEAAKKARIQGSVALHGVIGTDGKVKDVTVLSGPPELVDAAIEAVKQWLYKPYLLMGRPVDVQTEFMVNFTRNRG